MVSGLTSSIFVTTHSEAQGQQTKDNVFFVNLGYPSEYMYYTVITISREIAKIDKVTAFILFNIQD